VALEQGITTFTADVLPENAAMLGTFRKIARIQISSDAGIIKVQFMLTDVQGNAPTNP
jgi:hypothetical protein